MKSDVLALWPNAPLVETAPSGRWLRFADRTGRAVYLQRYAWDETSHAHYLVAGADSTQDRYTSLPEAVEAIREALAA